MCFFLTFHQKESLRLDRKEGMSMYSAKALGTSLESFHLILKTFRGRCGSWIEINNSLRVKKLISFKGESPAQVCLIPKSIYYAMMFSYCPPK